MSDAPISTPIATPASLQPAPIQQSPADQATEKAIESHITGAPPANQEAAFNRATVQHQREAAAQSKAAPDQGWRDNNDVAPLAPMPTAPTVEAREVTAAIAKLENLGGEHAELVQEWQATGANVGEELAYARSAFATIAANDRKLIAEVNRSGLGNHPSVLKFLATQGRLTAGLMNDHSISSRNNNSMTSSPIASGNNRGGSEAQSELNKLMRDNPPGSDRYKNPEVQQRVQQLSRMIAGSGSAIGQGGRTS